MKNVGQKQNSFKNEITNNNFLEYYGTGPNVDAIIKKFENKSKKTNIKKRKLARKNTRKSFRKSNKK